MMAESKQSRNHVRDSKEAGDLEEVHQGITCDLCAMSPILGIRYRCSVCPDFDVCSSCVTSRTQSGAHIPSHLYLRIDRTTAALQRRPQVSNRTAYVHHGFSCSECQVRGRPIVGVRFQCVQCQIDLCEACEAFGSHDPTHSRLKMISPQEEAQASRSVRPTVKRVKRPPDDDDRPRLMAAMLTASSGRFNFGALRWADSEAGLLEHVESLDLAVELRESTHM